MTCFLVLLGLPLLVGMESCRITTTAETDDARGTAAATATISRGDTLTTATLVDYSDNEGGDDMVDNYIDNSQRVIWG